MDSTVAIERRPTSRDAATAGDEQARSIARVALSAGAAGVLAFGVVALRVSARDPRTAAAAGALLSSTVAAGAAAWAGRRSARTTPPGRLLAAGIVVVAAIQAVGWVVADAHERPPGPVVFASVLGVLLAATLAALFVEARRIAHGAGARFVADVGLIAVIVGAAAYLLVHPTSSVLLAGAPTPLAVLGGLVLVAAAVFAVAIACVLSTWAPTREHLVFLLAAALAALPAFFAPATDLQPGSLVSPAAGDVALALALLTATLGMTLERRRGAIATSDAGEGTSAWGVPVGLLALGASGAVLMLVLVGLSPKLRVPSGEAVTLSIAVCGAVAFRTLLAQLEVSRAARALASALREKEIALGSLRTASDVLAASEEKHRLLLDAAVDGVVELDRDGTIVRANGAFCAMVGLAPDAVLAHRWDAVAIAAPNGGESLLTLPETGEAVLAGPNGTVYVEARSSPIGESPPGMLLLIRDTTASKAAEQTIRSLFQFLQDRDEDRTRLLQRSNAAIEAERNRIARDLHDGPIQGISAVTLSLEAVRLMLDSDDVPRAAETLALICGELGEEAVNLRRIMSDLRPPVLEERGLLPAIKELSARRSRELGIPVSVTGGLTAPLPEDVETLAYRVIQEALSNIGKHAHAGEVAIRVEMSAGTLVVDVTDDGDGFDANAAREFLRDGKVGLASMRERAELAGGTFNVKSEPGVGTTVMAVLPFEVLAAAPR